MSDVLTRALAREITRESQSIKIARQAGSRSSIARNRARWYLRENPINATAKLRANRRSRRRGAPRRRSRAGILLRNSAYYTHSRACILTGIVTSSLRSPLRPWSVVVVTYCADDDNRVDRAAAQHPDMRYVDCARYREYSLTLTDIREHDVTRGNQPSYEPDICDNDTRNVINVKKKKIKSRA